MASGEKDLVINEFRATAGSSLKKLTDSLRMPKRSQEYLCKTLAMPDKRADLHVRVREFFVSFNGSRGYRYIAHELSWGTTRLSRPRRLCVASCAKKEFAAVYPKERVRCSSHKGEIFAASGNLIGCDFHALAPSDLRLTDIA